MSGPEQNVEEQKLEQDLMRAMRRVEAPAGFADTVMQRVAQTSQRSGRVLTMPSKWRTVQMWAAGAVAAALVASVGVEHMHHRQERAEATRQFEVAMQIEQQALDRTRARLSRSGISLEQ